MADEESKARIVEISVSEPRNHGSQLMGKTTYLVVAELEDGKTIEVRRRYREFLWMARMWFQSYPDKVTSRLPTLPRKQFLGRFDPQFVRERMRGLDAFLKAAIESDDLQGDDLFLDAFLNPAIPTIQAALGPDMDDTPLGTKSGAYSGGSGRGKSKEPVHYEEQSYETYED